MQSQQKRTEVRRKLDRALTVRDLIAELEACDQDAVVVFQSDYGDYSHTQQALLVERVDEMTESCQRIETSAYSHSGLAICEDEDGFESEEGEDEDGLRADEQTKVVILSA